MVTKGCMLQIVYEDEQIVVINKPHDLLVHKTALAKDVEENAVDILSEQLGTKVYPVHRLDRKTSGLLLFTKNNAVVSYYQGCLSHEKTVKKYVALVRGFFPDGINLERSIPDKNDKLKSAETEFKCIEKFEVNWENDRYNTTRFSLVNAFPKTGRMHQIRRHLSHLNHPIIADRPHGCNKLNKMFLEKHNFKTMLLHAEKLEFFLPDQNRFLTFEAPLQNDFQETLNLIREESFYE